MPEPRRPIPAHVQQAAFDQLLHLNEAPDDADTLRRWQDWLAADPMHPRAWAKARRTWDLSGAVPPRRAVSLLRHPAVLAMAASVLLAVTVLFASGTGDLRTVSGETREAALEDGSRVVLDAGSALDLAFAEGARDVTLRRGEAYFQVARDAERPFRVRAGEVTVTVVGTAFDVRLGERTVDVAVEHGAVQVEFVDRASMRLSPGQGVSVGRANGAMTPAPVDRSGVAVWREGKLVVENASLSQVAEILERHYRGRLLIADRALASRRVTGVFDMRDPAAALRAAAAPHGGRVREWGGMVAVLDRG